MQSACSEIRFLYQTAIDRAFFFLLKPKVIDHTIDKIYSSYLWSFLAKDKCLAKFLIKACLFKLYWSGNDLEDGVLRKGR